MGGFVAALLIDKHGTIWPADSNALRLRYGAHCSFGVFERFLVRNLGFISLRSNERSCAIKAAAAKMSFKSYTALSESLTEEQASRVSLSLFDGDWQHSIHRDESSALSMLLKSASQIRQGEPTNYHAAPRSLDNLPTHPGLRDLLSAWTAKSGNIRIEDYPEIHQGQLNGRFVVIKKNEISGQLVFSKIGAGFAMYDNGWASRLVGQPVEYQPDLDYGRWVAQYWRSALVANQPTLHDVDAHISNPRDKTSRRVQYTRLTLPISARDGSIQLLSASLVNNGVSGQVEVR